MRMKYKTNIKTGFHKEEYSHSLPIYGEANNNTKSILESLKGDKIEAFIVKPKVLKKFNL